jgi:hypothetical protein
MEETDPRLARASDKELAPRRPNGMARSSKSKGAAGTRHLVARLSGALRVSPSSPNPLPQGASKQLSMTLGRPPGQPFFSDGLTSGA